MTGKQAATRDYVLRSRADVAEHLSQSTDEVGDVVFMTYPNGAKLKIGRMGGIDIVNVRTYPNALKAAVEADVLFDKQNERDNKKLASKPAIDALSAAAIAAENSTPETQN